MILKGDKMKLEFLGYIIEIKKKGDAEQNQELSERGAQAKRDRSKEKIDEALQEIRAKQLKYSEYRVQQISGLSINTIKKYRSYIEAERAKEKGLFE